MFCCSPQFLSLAVSSPLLYFSALLQLYMSLPCLVIVIPLCIRQVIQCFRKPSNGLRVGQIHGQAPPATFALPPPALAHNSAGNGTMATSRPRAAAKQTCMYCWHSIACPTSFPPLLTVLHPPCLASRLLGANRGFHCSVTVHFLCARGVFHFLCAALLP